jgi:hypothetical protein
MLEDAELKAAIRAMRRRDDKPLEAAWSYVERLLDIDGRPAWAVDDGGTRYIVVRDLVFYLDDLSFAVPDLRMAARRVFARLDA